MNSFQEKVSFIWGLADLLRGDYKQSDYAKVILPLTVLRRFDAIPNSTGLTFDDLAQQPNELPRYVSGLPPDIRDIFDHFRLTGEIDTLQRCGLLPLLMKRFSEIDLRPEAVSNHEMGYIFEELIRKFSEQSNESAGEHFTPREVIRLMVQLVLGNNSPDGKTLYDPACGTGGMLSTAEEYACERNPEARLEIYGQELNPESYAICKADALLRGHDARQIALGNSFLNDAFASRTFDYMLSNPPFGVEWKKAERHIRDEQERLGFAGRFGAGLPRITDGSLLFLQHMLSKMKPEGTRMAVVFNGSPLFSGDAGSGESEIRRWIFENDWIEAVIALPDKLFYNTGLATYIWVLTNRKTSGRKGKVQLIDATGLGQRMRRSLGAKRNEIRAEDIQAICGMHQNGCDGPHSKLLNNADFGYRRMVIERPLRLRFQVTPLRIRAAEQKFGPALTAALSQMDTQTIYRDQAVFDSALALAFKRSGIKFGRTMARRIREVFAEQDDEAEIYRDGKGRPLPDADLRDYEDVPLEVDFSSWFEREVLPHAPDAWIGGSETHAGYIIPFSRYFFQPEAVRSLREIEGEIQQLEREAQSLLQQLGTA